MSRGLFAKIDGIVVCAAIVLVSLFFWAASSRAQEPVSPPATSNPATNPATSAAPTPRSAAPFREVTDEDGRTVRIPQIPRRVVSLAPSITETLYALNLQDVLVGDTDYCDFPPDAQRKPKVGGAINPSIEAIAALQPDLVLVTKGLNRLETVSSLEGLGIPSYSVDPQSVVGIISSTQRIADILGAPEAGETLAADLRHQLADTQQRVAPLPPRRVLFIVWTQPLISIGKDTFIADALRCAGATSIVEATQSWPQMNLEEVARLQPDFLVFATSHTESTPINIDALAELPGWRILSAVKDHRYAVTTEAIERTTPRIVSAITDLARQFHPEAFQAPDAARTQVPPQKITSLVSEAYTCAR